jgi:HAD superfamily phosphatase
MEDAPGKPDPTGLLATVEQLASRDRIEGGLPVLYAGDTVADMHTVAKAKALHPERTWIGVGILPPHVQETLERSEAYAESLKKAGASVVLPKIEQLTPQQIQQLLDDR